MSSISFGGLATGLDTGSIVSQLVALRRQPIVKLEGQKKLYEQQKAAFKDLQTKLTALMTAADGLDTAQSFGSLKAASSLENLLTASAASEAQEGTYAITVESLARAQKDLSQAYSSQVAEVGTGTFTITVGGEVTDAHSGRGRQQPDQSQERHQRFRRRRPRHDHQRRQRHQSVPAGADGRHNRHRRRLQRRLQRPERRRRAHAYKHHRGG